MNPYYSKLESYSLSVMKEGSDRDKIDFLFTEGIKQITLKPGRREELMALRNTLKQRPQHRKLLFSCDEYLQVEKIYKERREENEEKLNEKRLKQIVTEHSICLIGREEDFDELAKWRGYQSRKKIIPEMVFISKLLIPLHHDAGPVIGRALALENRHDIILYWQDGCDADLGHLRGCLSPAEFYLLDLSTAQEIAKEFPRTQDVHFRWSPPASETESLCSVFDLHWKWGEKSHTLTLRIYGPNEEARFGFERRREYDLALDMGFVGEAPEVVDLFENFRIEKPDATVCISLTDLLDDDHRDLPIAIARKLYEFHDIHRYSPLLPVDKKPGLWTRLKFWGDRVSDFGVKGIKLEKLGNLINLFEDKFSRSSVSGFCHNNICVRNILRWKSKPNHVFLTSLLKSKAII